MRTDSQFARCLFLLSSMLLNHCGSNPGSTRIVPEPTRIIVQPNDFLGDTYCGPEATALSSYTATLLDVSLLEDEPFALPSSQVVSCTSTLTFEAVEPGRRYVALISAYEESDDELRSSSLGSPIIVDSDGTPTSPRWQTICWGEEGAEYSSEQRGRLDNWNFQVESDAFSGAGGGGGAGGAYSDWPLIGARAYFNTAIRIAGCDPLSDNGSIGPTGVSVSLAASLAGKSCGNSGAEITEFQVQLTNGVRESDTQTDSSSRAGAGGAASATTTTSCNETFQLLGLASSQQVELEVTAFTADGIAQYSTTCRAFTRLGAVIPANCDPLELTP